MRSKNFDKLKIEKLPNAEAQITGEITLSFLVSLRDEAIKNLAKGVKIDGFREGHIPQDLLVKKIGEMGILEEMAELALGKVYPEIIKEAKLSVIGKPEIAITKLAPSIPLEFKIKVYLEPEFDLPDYKKIAKDVVVEGEDTSSEEYKNKKRAKIIEELVKAVKVGVPSILVESEISKMVMQFKEDVSRAGVKWEEYLKEIKKTDAQLREEWRPRALDRVKAELVFIKIGEKEKIEPKKEELEKEVKHILAHHPKADPLNVHIFVYTYLRNQKVLSFLEAIK